MLGKTWEGKKVVRQNPEARSEEGICRLKIDCGANLTKAFEVGILLPNSGLVYLNHCTVYNQNASGRIFNGDFMRKTHAGAGIRTHDLPTG